MTNQSAKISPLAALSFQGAIVAVGWLAVWSMGPSGPEATMGWVEATGWGICGSVVTYLTLSTLSRLPGVVQNSLSDQMRQLYVFACSYSWPVLIVLSVFAGVGEELLFRGAVQGWLARHTNEWVAVVAASLLFGLVHYLSFTYFIIATGLGLVLGAVYALTDSLLLVMVWHGAYDMIALYCLRRFPHLFGIGERSLRP